MTSATTTAAASTPAFWPTACRTAGAWTTTSTLHHPLQQAIRRDVARAVGMDATDLKMGIDGCSAPNYAMPLVQVGLRLCAGWPVAPPTASLARSFAAAQRCHDRHPEMVSGTGRNDLAFMQCRRRRLGQQVWAPTAFRWSAAASRGEALPSRSSTATSPPCLPPAWR